MALTAEKQWKKQGTCGLVLLIWTGLALAALLFAPAAFLTDAAYFALLPMGAFAGILLKEGLTSYSGLFSREKRGRFLAALVFSGLFFMQLSIAGLLGGPLFSEAGLSAIWWPNRLLRLLYLGWNWTGFLILYVLSVFLCLYRMTDWFLQGRKQGGELLSIPHTGLYMPVVSLFVVCAVTIFASSPSLIIGDASTVLAWARDGIWNEWHTAGYLLFVRVIWLICGTSRGVTVVQGLLYVLVQNYALGLFCKDGMDRRAGRRYIALCILSFVPIYFLQAAIKDVVFSLCVLGFSLGVLGLVREYGPRKRDFLWTGLFGLGVCLFRHAGLLPVFVTLAALCLRFLLKNKKAVTPLLITGASVGLCYVLLVNVLVLSVLKAERNPEIVPYSAPMTMIGAVAKSGVPLTSEDRAIMERVMPVEKWAACYDNYFADSLSRSYGKIGADAEKVNTLHLGPELLKLNLHFLLRYPAVYLTAFFDLNSLMWEITTPQDGYVRSYLSYPLTAVYELVAQEGYAEEGTDRITKELKQPEDTAFTAAAAPVNRYAEFLYGMPVLKSILWRGGFSLFMLVFAGWILIKKNRANTLLAMIPIFTIVLTMLFSMPAQEVRYAFPELECGLFFSAYAFFCATKNKARENHA